jgi:hypothetical protein
VNIRVSNLLKAFTPSGPPRRRELLVDQEHIRFDVANQGAALLAAVRRGPVLAIRSIGVQGVEPKMERSLDGPCKLALPQVLGREPFTRPRVDLIKKSFDVGGMRPESIARVEGERWLMIVRTITGQWIDGHLNGNAPEILLSNNSHIICTRATEAARTVRNINLTGN